MSPETASLFVFLYFSKKVQHWTCKLRSGGLSRKVFMDMQSQLGALQMACVLDGFKGDLKQREASLAVGIGKE